MEIANERVTGLTTCMDNPGDRGGKTGVPRITMAWSRENYDHITLMAALTGQSMTAYVNGLVDADRERNAEVAAKARDLAAEVRHAD